MADNKCGRFIVHMKKESNARVFLLEEPGNTKKGWNGRQIVNKGARLQERHVETIQAKHGPWVVWWLEHRTPNRRAWARCSMASSTLRVRTR
ncbi:hypothetical protein TNCV_3210471 [Trichonephila clavipes]|nr:hypothetical protein TNCV_3210471 [Trichonephila clavipes]